MATVSHPSSANLGNGADLDLDADPRQPIDATVRIVTPERVAFTYPVAGPARRGLAYAIDLAVIGASIYLAGLVIVLLTGGSRAGLGVRYAMIFAVVWGYGAGCEGIANGRTLGKRVVGLRVIGVRGVPITGSQAVVRNLVGVVDGPAAFLFLPALVCMTLTHRFQRLGDLAAGTMVVIEEERSESRLVRVEDRAVLDLLPSLPLRVAMGPATARALADYVRHRPRFAPARREEMARPLAGPLRERFGLPDSSGGDAVLCATYHRVFLGE